MTTPTLMDYDADAGVRLRELMKHQDISFRDRLKQSASTAGEQLEWAKPGFAGTGKGGGLYIGSAVMLPVGTVIILLAQHKKVLTIRLQADACPLTEIIEQAVGYFEALIADASVPSLTAPQALHAAADQIKEHGHPPGKTGIELAGDHNARIVGMLFAPLPPAERAHVIEGLEVAIAQRVCPVLACLLGKGSKTGMCGAWPLFLPLAPYADAVLAEEG